MGPALQDGSGPAKLLAVFCANVDSHRAMACRRGSVCRCARATARGGRLFLYGPFKRDGRHTALSNAVFDTSLRDRDAEWGVRDIDDLEKLAAGKASA